MKLISRVVYFGAILLFLCLGCNNDQSRNPEFMLGHWMNSRGKPELFIGKDSLEYYVIVYHRLASGKKCPIRYPLVYKENSTYIKAESRILLVYSRQNKTLFLSPGGEYYSFYSK